jgi:outer membrane protein TolC
LNDRTLAPPSPFGEALAAMNAVVPAAPGAGVQTPALPDQRTAVQEVAAVVRLREASLDAARAERRPNVSMNSSFSQVAYPSGFFPTGDFRTNWTVGASVQLPLLTGGRLRAEERMAQADLDQSRAQLQQVRELAALDSRAAWAELLAAQAAWEATAATIEQAARAYEIADVRYRAGVSTQLELSDARVLLQQSEANRAQTARDLQVARARLALLPDLPLSGGAARPVQLPFSAPAIPAPSSPQQPQQPGLRNAAAGSVTQGGGIR